MVYQQKEHCVDKNREDILRMKEDIRDYWERMTPIWRGILTS